MKALALATMLVIGGCTPSTYHFKCQDCDRSQFRMTDYKCQRDAQSFRAVPTFGQTYPNSAGISVPYISGSTLVPDFNDNLFVLCMAAHGYIQDRSK